MSEEDVYAFAMTWFLPALWMATWHWCSDSTFYHVAAMQIAIHTARLNLKTRSQL